MLVSLYFFFSLFFYLFICSNNKIKILSLSIFESSTTEVENNNSENNNSLDSTSSKNVDKKLQKESTGDSCISSDDRANKPTVDDCSLISSSSILSTSLTFSSASATSSACSPVVDNTNTPTTSEPKLKRNSSLPILKQRHLNKTRKSRSLSKNKEPSEASEAAKQQHNHVKKFFTLIGAPFNRVSARLANYDRLADDSQSLLKMDQTSNQKSMSQVKLMLKSAPKNNFSTRPSTANFTRKNDEEPNGSSTQTRSPRVISRPIIIYRTSSAPIFDDNNRITSNHQPIDKVISSFFFNYNPNRFVLGN